jgi:hypothetical protein
MFRKGHWVQPKHNNGIRDQGLKQQLLRGNGNVNEARRQTIVLEVVKLAAWISNRIRKMSVKTLWRNWPPPLLKKRLPIAEEREMYMV